MSDRYNDSVFRRNRSIGTRAHFTFHIVPSHTSRSQKSLHHKNNTRHRKSPYRNLTLTQHTLIRKYDTRRSCSDIKSGVVTPDLLTVPGTNFIRMLLRTEFVLMASQSIIILQTLHKDSFDETTIFVRLLTCKPPFFEIVKGN